MGSTVGAQPYPSLHSGFLLEIVVLRRKELEKVPVILSLSSLEGEV